jgi:murein DD-endopeptidase MepM/ murein hydrolase activator NlpD
MRWLLPLIRRFDAHDRLRHNTPLVWHGRLLMRRSALVSLVLLLSLAAVWLIWRPDWAGGLGWRMPTPVPTAAPPEAANNGPAAVVTGPAPTLNAPSAPTPLSPPPASPTPLPTLARAELAAGLATTRVLTTTGEMDAQAVSEPSATATRPVTLVPVPADPVDRTCPDPAPLKPDYFRHYLDGAPWPAPNAALGSHFWLAKPVPGGGRFLITDWFPYGYDGGGRYLLHNGVDAAEPLGSPVLAVDSGTVVVAGPDWNRNYGWRCDWYGHLVVIELDRRWLELPVYALYGHVLNITVQPGQRVARGEQVAEIGFGGAASTPHLHFEVRVGANTFGSTRNPLLWVQPPITRGLIAGRLLDPDGRPWQGVAVTAVGRSEGTADRTSWTYLGDPQSLINPDEGLAENFVIDDLVPGEYEVWASVQGVEYRAGVTVTGGQLSTVEIRTEVYKTPTPAPEPGETPSPEP